MKKTTIYLIGVLGFILLVVGILTASPYYYYNKLLKNDYDNQWYELSSYQERWLKPDTALELGEYEDANPDLWKDFHLMDVLVPLPVKNPFYYVTADLRYKDDINKTLVGLVFYGTNKKEISKIFFSENQLMPNVLNAQKLFSLPLVNDQLIRLDDEQVWKDIFTKDISSWNVKFSEMMYNLYLLQLREKVLPKKINSYALIKDTSSGIIELESQNKDYKNELILTRSRGFIYSYLLVTRVTDEESQQLRLKLLKNIGFRGGSEYLAPIIYKEFKALKYEDKIDHEGMLYLLSAFTHDINNSRFIEDMIQNLERGEKNEKQLAPLYRYANKRFGKTFASKFIKGIEISDELKLKRALELEEKRDREKIVDNKPEIEPNKSRTSDDIYKEKLRDAKESMKSKKDRMFID